MVCFDVLFKEPGVTLAEELGVDSIVFPTAWSSKLPLMQGLGYHEAWAHRMGVNMLSSGRRHYIIMQVSLQLVRFFTRNKHLFMCIK